MSNSKHILVVDDEPMVRESCERIFNEIGYDVETVASAKEGLERTNSGYFDCALIDLKLPDMDGMEIVRSARVNHSDMAVLIITGYGSAETAAESTRLGVSDYLCKPFTPEELATAVERALHAPLHSGVPEIGDRFGKVAKEDVAKCEHDESPSAQDLVLEPMPWKWKLQNWKSFYWKSLFR